MFLSRLKKNKYIFRSLNTVLIGWSLKSVRKSETNEFGIYQYRPAIPNQWEQRAHCLWLYMYGNDSRDTKPWLIPRFKALCEDLALYFSSKRTIGSCLHARMCYTAKVWPKEDLKTNFWCSFVSTNTFLTIGV